MILELLAVVVLLILSGVFSGSESAMLGANRLHLAAEAEAGRRGARMARRLLDDPERLFSFLLLGNNVVNIALAALVTVLVSPWAAGWGPLASTAILAPVLLVCGEIVPKTLALRSADRLAPAVAGPLWLGVRLTAPVIGVLAWLARFMSRGSGSQGGMVESREELRLLLEVSGATDEIPEEELRTAFRVFDFGEKTAVAAMRPLVDVVALPRSATRRQATELAVETGYSRLPIFDGRVDNLVGLVHVRDLLRAREGDSPVAALMRPTPYVPETQRLPDLLATLQRERRAMAFVVDEYGAVTGIITVEDLVEEIVGEITDEYDRRSEEPIQSDDQGGYLVSGRAELEILADRLGRSLPWGPYETAAGLVIHAAGRIPAVGEIVETSGIRFQIEEADQRRVRLLRVLA